MPFELGCSVATARPTLAEATLGLRRARRSSPGRRPVRAPRAPRHLLETALGLRTAAREPPTSSELGLAVIRLLEMRSPDQSPLIIVINDLQWADAGTRDVLTFVMRRLPSAGVFVLATHRTAADPPINVPRSGADAPRPARPRAALQRMRKLGHRVEAAGCGEFDTSIARPRSVATSDIGRRPESSVFSCQVCSRPTADGTRVYCLRSS